MSSGVLTSLGVRIQRLVTTAAVRALQRQTSSSSSASSSVASPCRFPLTDIDEDDRVVVNSKRLEEATARRQAADHVDRHVRSSGMQHQQLQAAKLQAVT